MCELRKSCTEGSCRYLALNEVTNTGLGHDGDGDGGHDLLDELGVGHARNAALNTDVGGDTLKRHDGDGTGLLGDAGLLGVDDVHDDSPLEHAGEAGLDGEVGGLGGGAVDGECGRHDGGLEYKVRYLEIWGAGGGEGYFVVVLRCGGGR